MNQNFHVIILKLLKNEQKCLEAGDNGVSSETWTHSWRFASLAS